MVITTSSSDGQIPLRITGHLSSPTSSYPSFSQSSKNSTQQVATSSSIKLSTSDLEPLAQTFQLLLLLQLNKEWVLMMLWLFQKSTIGNIPDKNQEMDGHMCAVPTLLLFIKLLVSLMTQKSMLLNSPLRMFTLLISLIQISKDQITVLKLTQINHIAKSLVNTE